MPKRRIEILDLVNPYAGQHCDDCLDNIIEMIKSCAQLIVFLALLFF